MGKGAGQIVPNLLPSSMTDDQPCITHLLGMMPAFSKFATARMIPSPSDTIMSHMLM